MENGMCSIEDFRKAEILREKGYTVEIFEFKVILPMRSYYYDDIEIVKPVKQLIAYKGERPEIKELDDFRHCPYLLEKMFNKLVVDGE